MTYRLVPARRSLAESEEFERVVGKEIADVARASLDDAVLFGPTLWTHLGPDLDVFTEAVGKIVAGEMTAAEAMDWAAQNIADQ
jgi:ABC-type glycerol-3-phosphate transport system substrate-binding protein